MIPWLFGEVGAANVAPILNIIKSLNLFTGFGYRR
jgi:hypothetical protein